MSNEIIDMIILRIYHCPCFSAPIHKYTILYYHAVLRGRQSAKWVTSCDILYSLSYLTSMLKYIAILTLKGIVNKVSYSVRYSHSTLISYKPMRVSCNVFLLVI